MVVVTAGTGGHKVLLISGKQNGSSSSTQGYSRSISVVLPSSSNQANSSDSDSNSTTGPPLRKRQRLTHLSPEEKQLRRKLKNRVAAQTARDRKKAKMGELEEQVLALELENQKLHVENRLLRQKTCGLVNENEELRQRLGLDTLEAKEEKVQVLEASGIDAVLGIGSSECSTQATCASAAGAGPAYLKSEDFPMDTNSPDPTDSESDLLLGILDILDPELFLRECDEQEVQEQAVLLVGGGGGVPAPPPAPMGATPVKLEALNELIHFDHIYTKPVDEVACVLGQQGVNYEESVDERKTEEVAVFSVTEGEVGEVEVESDVCVKDEPEEAVIIPESRGVLDDFLSPASPTSDLALGRLEKTGAYLTDAYSDSGYERSPSPFSDMSSPLCSEGSWDDVFANELFPQLISV
ncbi:LOW QUALITY PROTEIN: X-box-binding protein 1 [Esox lucius]|uniref:LOW QUALITY PROTEIN: X-box-binding protein 1 n=1 Tax=Esox lucius TaxID=8010 RepID=UPI0006619DB9|nr:LOW QUALITY PROTEIN: X-box-binding protein 1 [Esox lucius]